MQPRVPPPGRVHVPKLIQRRYTVLASMTADGIEREMPLEAEAAPHEDGDEAGMVSDAELGEAAEDVDKCEAASEAEAPPEDGDEAEMASNAELAEAAEDGDEAANWPWRRRQRSRRT